MPKSEFEKHLDKDSRCEKRPPPEDDRISDELMSELRKVNTFASARTQEEKWNILYKKLFPNDSDIPSPCKFFANPIISTGNAPCN